MTRTVINYRAVQYPDTFSNVIEGPWVYNNVLQLTRNGDAGTQTILVPIELIASVITTSEA